MADDAVAVLDACERRPGPRRRRIDGRGARACCWPCATPSGCGRSRWCAPPGATTSGAASCWRAGRRRPPSRAWGRWPARPPRWVIGPRSFRRLMPVLGWLGPLGLNRPAHAFAAQVRAILRPRRRAPTELLATIDVPTLVIVGNQDILTPRGDSEELAERHPRRRAGGDLRRRPRPDGRARRRRSTGCCSSSSAARCAAASRRAPAPAAAAS